MIDDLTKRLARLPSEKRKLVEQLLERDGVHMPHALAGPATAPHASAGDRTPFQNDAEAETRLLHESGPLAIPPALSPDLSAKPTPEQVKAHHRVVYDRLNDQLSSSPFAEYIRFCNYGYVADSNVQYSPVSLPRYLLNKSTVKLVLEVIGDCDLSGREILDVGCGRGGTVSVITEYFRPKRVAALDLSTRAVAFCRRNNAHGFVSYCEGDAEELPFQDGEFDVLTNIESSHSYPSIINFYQGVWRVLRPGGLFLYADLFPLQRWNENILHLREIGFSPERNQDITHNVLLSCDQTAASKAYAYAPHNNRDFMADFLGMPDSYAYKSMQSGAWSYRILKLSKGERHG